MASSTMNPIILENTELMLRRRGYVEFQKGSNYLSAIDKNEQTIVAFFVEHTKVTIDVIKTILSSSKIKDVVIIHAKMLTPDAKQAVIVNNIFRFETFSFDEMSYDPIEIVYPHTLFTDPVKEKHKLPIILSTDIIARYYSFKKGDVILIDEEGQLVLRRCV